MPIDRKIARQTACILLALPVLYVLSSGPVLRWCGRTKDPLVLRNPDTYLVVETGTKRSRVVSAPMVEIATAIHLRTPLFVYLKLWKVVPVMTNQDRVFFFLVESEASRGKP